MSKDDIFIQGDCDASVTKLCSILGWKDDLIQQNEQTKVIVTKKGTPRKSDWNIVGMTLSVLFILWYRGFVIDYL